MDKEGLGKFIEAGLPDDWVVHDRPGKTTRILAELVDNEMLKDCLKEIRAGILFEDLSACQKFTLLMLNYV